MPLYLILTRKIVQVETGKAEMSLFAFWESTILATRPAVGQA